MEFKMSFYIIKDDEGWESSYFYSTSYAALEHAKKLAGHECNKLVNKYFIYEVVLDTMGGDRHIRKTLVLEYHTKSKRIKYL